MKKIVVLITSVLLLVSIASAAEDLDLSVYSFEELAALRDRIQLEMMSRDEWQEVEVPQGVYQVGVDIPAGKWTVTCRKGQYTEISFGTKLDNSGDTIAFDFGGVYSLYNAAYNPAYKYYSKADGNPLSYTLDAKDGYWVVVAASPAIFAPYTGKPDLGFK